MAFLLKVDRRPDGFTHITYDTGPTSRTTVAILTEHTDGILGVPAGDLVDHLSQLERPPTINRRHQ